MLETHFFNERWGWRRLFRRPRIIAVFSFRYDAHLVPDLIENLRPLVDGYVAYDDRGATEAFSSEPARRRLLMDAARRTRARWILAIDPDERFERAAAERFPRLTRVEEPVVWGFHFRELYAADAYRVDGVWGKKSRHCLFPVLDGQEFGTKPLHEEHYPKGYIRRKTKLNLYHLKMITRERRVARRDLYKALDPEHKMQARGYDYLADEQNAVLKPIPADRGYWPPHTEDGGLWMPAIRRPDGQLGRIADRNPREPERTALAHRR